MDHKDIEQNPGFEGAHMESLDERRGLLQCLAELTNPL
jgi:hypothetical protein